MTKNLRHNPAFIQLVNELKEMQRVQGYDGNWNANPYMHGLYNGMEAVLCILEGREPKYKERPSVFLDEIEEGQAESVVRYLH